MRSIFFARGPNIKPGTNLQSIQNIELFNLFSDLLQLRKDTPNNGTEGVMHPVLRGLRPKAPVLQQDSRPLPYPDDLRSIAEFGGAGGRAEAEEVREERNYEKLVCTGTSSLCVTKMCETGVLMDGKKTLGSPTRGQIQRDPSVNCAFVDSRFDSSCSSYRALRKQQRDAQLEWQSIFVDAGNTFTSLDRTQFMMYKKFTDGPFNYLQELTYKYVRKYSDILSISGAIYDFNFDGLADKEDVKPRENPPTQEGHPVPSHIVRILIRCEKGGWESTGSSARTRRRRASSPFVLPNAPDLNCLKADDYLLANTARVRDIELLSGVNFFKDPALFELPAGDQLAGERRHRIVASIVE
ncbi:Ectonucleotide pyrophosphatase/phosphodiesterase C27A7.1 [Aphelenchoides fujianensis]|nr:Ectonucleotide pyrophosphatase/phosphodiesterase C27A7.1 [Aphelenchoides fujianensis]